MDASAAGATAVPSCSQEPARLRIVIVTENIMPKVDGVTRCLARLLAHLKEEGHSVVVLGPRTKLVSCESYPLIGTAGIPLGLYAGLKLNFLRPLFIRTICEFKPDVIHILDPVFLGAQVLIALKSGLCGSRWSRNGSPIVASYHTNLPAYAALYGIGPPWIQPYQWRYLRWLHAMCLLTACPTNSIVRLLSERGFKNTRIWPRGVDHDVFAPVRRSHCVRKSYGIPGAAISSTVVASLPTSSTSERRATTGGSGPLEDPVVVLSVGRISCEKNLILLIYAFALLLDQIPEGKPTPRLVFVGDGPVRPQLELLARHKGLDTCFIGHVEDPLRLAEYYASADVFASPSYTETFGQVVCEALASGLPVVGLDASGTRDLVVDGRTGLLLPNHSSSEWNDIFADSSSATFEEAAVDFSHLLRKVVFDTDLRTSMSRRAVKEGSIGRSWEQAMDAMVDCYREGIAISGDLHPRASSGDRYLLSAKWHLSLHRYVLVMIFLGSFGAAYRFLPII